VKKLTSLLAALSLTVAMAAPGFAQQVEPSLLAASEVCVGCHAYLVFPTPAGPEPTATQNDADQIRPRATTAAADGLVGEQTASLLASHKQ
jgi:hypothetical protein